MAIRNLEDALADIDARILAEVSGAKVSYHWALPGLDPDHLAHKGIGVRCDSTTNTGLLRDQERPGVFGDSPVAWVEDDLAVVFHVRIRSGAQRSSRDEAITLARQIRAALTGVSWMRGTLGCDLHYEGETYQSASASPAWISVEQRWQMTRQAPIADATGT